jgi:hypothetical protein
LIKRSWRQNDEVSGARIVLTFFLWLTTDCAAPFRTDFPD